jgi:hypothetical protein
MATRIWGAAPEFRAMAYFLFFRRETWLQPLDSDSLSVLYLLDEGVSFGKQEIGIQGEYA